MSLGSLGEPEEVWGGLEKPWGSHGVAAKLGRAWGGLGALGEARGA